MSWKQNPGKLVNLVLLIILVVFVTTTKTSLFTADLGRHLTNGELLISKHELLRTNLYSYTHSNFPVITHHWLGSLFLYVVWNFGNFNILSLFYILVTTSTFVFIYLTSVKNSNHVWATVATLLTLPLIAYRTEIRPEMFSYFFTSVFIYILNKYRGKPISKQIFITLGLIQLLWINTHILFFVGPGLVGIYALDAFYQHKKLTNNAKQLLLLLLTVLAASFITPFGLKGTFIPVNIFNNFGYRLLENQSVWFIEKLIHNPLFSYYKIAFGVLVLSFLLNIGGKDRNWLRLDHLLIAIVISVAGWLAIRNFALFGYITIPIFSYNLHYLSGSYLKSLPKKTINIVVLIVGFVLLLGINNKLLFIFPKTPLFGLGIHAQTNDAANFFKDNNLKGPIFNNYDIGGYLIYHLFPQEKVFVDNRPEAYPAEFFQDVYIPMQENNDIWEKYSKIYDFNSIFFYLRDATPWGQNFLIQRVKDPNWVPVYADQHSIIFLKDNETNLEVIKKYRLPDSYFSITSR